MKNFLALCTFFTLFLSLMSCHQDETNPSNSTGSVTFKIDSTSSFTSSYSGGIWDSNNALMNITAKSGKSLIVINTVMPNGLKVGSYSFNASSGLSTTFYRPDTLITNEGYYSTTSGSSGIVTITSVSSDSLVTGTFGFILVNPVTGTRKILLNGTITGVKIVNNASIVSTGTNSFSRDNGGIIHYFNTCYCTI